MNPFKKAPEIKDNKEEILKQLEKINASNQPGDSKTAKKMDLVVELLIDIRALLNK